MTQVNPLPHRGDFITLEAPREQSAVAICVGHTRAGALRVRRLVAQRGILVGCFDPITTYRGTWRPLAVTDPRHPAYNPMPDVCLEELGL